MVVALPLIDRVAGVAVAVLADELGGVGEAPEVPEVVPGVPDDPDEAVDVPDEVPEPAEVLDAPAEMLGPVEVLAAVGVLAWTSTDAGEHPNSIADGTNTTDETNTVVMTLDSLMRPSWPNAPICRRMTTFP
jgi:hypothetical protein